MPPDTRLRLGRAALYVALWTLAAPVLHAADLDALNLQVEPAEATTTAQGPKVFVEGTLGWSEQRYGLGERSISRLALDARHNMLLGDAVRGAVSARLDYADPEDERLGHTTFSLREAYLGWQDSAAENVVELGRINLREGPGYGYNPTDFFRSNALRTLNTQNPFSLRENRLGSAMLRVQRLWGGNTLAAAYSPKLANSPSDNGMSLDLGATNSRDRGLISLGNRVSDEVSTRLTVYREAGSPLRFGASGTALLSDALVAHAEWSTSREPDLLTRALGQSANERRRQRIAGGLTYTTATRLSVTAELQYNGFALDRDGWQALAAAGLPAQAAYITKAVSLQDNAAREAVLLYAVQRDLAVKGLDLTVLARLNRSDRSSLAWLELRYSLDRLDLSLQLLHSAGGNGTEFGIDRIRRAASIAATVYF